MKGLLIRIIAAFAAVASICFAAQSFAHNNHRDWKTEMARTGGDLVTFLKYQPTDGASQGGKVRKAIDPARAH